MFMHVSCIFQYHIFCFFMQFLTALKHLLELGIVDYYCGIVIKKMKIHIDFNMAMLGLPKHYDVEWGSVLAGIAISGFGWVLGFFLRVYFICIWNISAHIYFLWK